MRGIEQHLYIVELVGVGVKVGITINPKARIATHRRDAAAYKREVGRLYISIPHIEARENERRLIALGDGRREYMDVDYERALDLAGQLPRTRATRQQSELLKPVEQPESQWEYSIEAAAQELQGVGYMTGRKRLTKLMWSLGWLRRARQGGVRPTRDAIRDGFLIYAPADDSSPFEVWVTESGLAHLAALFERAAA